MKISKFFKLLISSQCFQVYLASQYYALDKKAHMIKIPLCKLTNTSVNTTLVNSRYVT